MHRVSQFIGHLTARVDSSEEARAMTWLPPTARTLFQAMPVADRRHALDVVGRLEDGGVADADVLAAALLHDAAKGHRMRVWHRVAGVVLDAVAPGLLRRVASDRRDSWRYPYFLYLEHARLSADEAVRAGCSERTARFIRGDVDAAERPLLDALRAADAAS